MQRSSSSIASLAGALAKAQAELVNPEKSLVATIHPQARGEAERSFRYAPLSSGLDIVRKTLGQHEIATLQTTAIDQATGLVNLTTVLAHASGEWIASDWPVCALSETKTPHRMGAALTYARRYALFTLVGIAGEDDLDAPDLAAPSSDDFGIKRPPVGDGTSLNGGQNGSARKLEVGGAKAYSKSLKPILDTEDSAALRTRLAAELEVVASADDAASWAYRSLGAKNKLTAADAKHVEDAFQARLATFGPAADISDAPLFPTLSAPQNPLALDDVTTATTAMSKGIDKSQLAYPEPRRVRDKEHVRFVAKQSCLICGRRPSDSHHLRFAQRRALGRKVSDEFTVPLCRGHHREVHRCGDEAAWWKKANINPSVPARALWLETHPLPTASDSIGKEDESPVASLGSVKSNARSSKRRSDNKTNPIQKTAPNDFV